MKSHDLLDLNPNLSEMPSPLFDREMCHPRLEQGSSLLPPLFRRYQQQHVDLLRVREVVEGNAKGTFPPISMLQMRDVEGERWESTRRFGLRETTRGVHPDELDRLQTIPFWREAEELDAHQVGGVGFGDEVTWVEGDVEMRVRDEVLVRWVNGVG